MKSFLTKHLKNSRAAAFFITCLTCSALMCLAVFAEGETVDVNSIMTSTVAEIATTLMAGLGIVVTGLVGFIAAKTGVIKLINFLQQMTGNS